MLIWIENLPFKSFELFLIYRFHDYVSLYSKRELLLANIYNCQRHDWEAKAPLLFFFIICVQIDTPALGGQNRGYVGLMGSSPNALSTRVVPFLRYRQQRLTAPSAVPRLDPDSKYQVRRIPNEPSLFMLGSELPRVRHPESWGPGQINFFIINRIFVHTKKHVDTCNKWIIIIGYFFQNVIILNSERKSGIAGYMMGSSYVYIDRRAAYKKDLTSLWRSRRKVQVTGHFLPEVGKGWNDLYLNTWHER